MRNKIDEMDLEPVLVAGNEDDLYPGEIKEIVLAVLSQAYKDSMNKDCRRAHVIADIIEENNYQDVCNERKQLIKSVLNNYNGMTSKVKGVLEKTGFQIKEEGKHYKLIYYGDKRYTVILSKTPSDWRGSKNVTSEIINKVF